MRQTLRRLVGSLVVVFAITAGAEAETVALYMPGGEARLSFDSRTISEDQVQQLALISPHLSWFFVSPIWEDAAGPLEGPDLREAEVTLRDLAETLEDIAHLDVPAELEAARAYVRREGAFYVCLRRAQLAYYGGDDHALAVECDEIDAPTSCWDLVVEAPLLRTVDKRHELAAYAWRNCMSDRFQERLGHYPLDNWRAFLERFGVEEDIIEHEGC